MIGKKIRPGRGVVWCEVLCVGLALLWMSPLASGQDAAAGSTEEAQPAGEAGEAGDSATGSGSAGAGDSGAAGDDSGAAAEIENIFEQEPAEAVSTLWNATLFTAGDTDIKLNQIIIALIAAIIGLWLAKLLTGMISRRLVRVSKVSETVAFTIGKVIFYVSAIVVLLIAMQIAGIPTTVFTVLGGAIAIGVGFGAQNLFNNLISGIILLTEKPIRRRDIVVIDGMEGQVAEIGNRCTRIRMGDGIDMLVPNSKFLENNVVNWTLFDAKVRGHVDVGVAYGSPVQKVRELLCDAANAHEKVDTAPPPVVLFTEFGDNTLNFSVYFWCEVTKPLDRRLIESDLRFAIDELFHEHQITIAFPQRDIHLDTLKPLEVRMVAGEGPGAADSSN